MSSNLSVEQEMTKYISTKTYRQIGPVAYRQWRADSHCRLIHGYALSFHFEFECDTLDARNWCMDFGGLKPLKALLEDWFDHTLLVAEDDPQRACLLLYFADGSRAKLSSRSPYRKHDKARSRTMRQRSLPHRSPATW